MDHGIFYEHERFFQLLFGTSQDSVEWQLKNRGYKVRKYVLSPDIITADWDDGCGIEIRFDAMGTATAITYHEYYAVLDGPPNPPKPVVRRFSRKRI
jgi:hypothetical protein